MKIGKKEYHDGGVNLEGYYASLDEHTDKKPGVLICHDWTGRNEFAEKKAIELAELGYVGFAIDMFGKGILGITTEEKSDLIKPFMNDRQKLLNRILAGFETLKTLPHVDTNRLAAMGFCFGGLCVLDLARSGTDLRGVVSFHGLLNAPANLSKHKIKASVLALHGHDDPMAPPNEVRAFEDEMTEAGADWQVHIYGGVQHAFTNPLANDTKLGTIFNKTAEKRSWQSMKNFFEEVLF